GVAASLAALETDPQGRARTAAFAALGFSALLAGFARAPTSVVPATACLVLAGRAALRDRAPVAVLVASLRARAVALGLALGCALPVAYFALGDVVRFRDINAYHRAFLGVAASSSDPSAALGRL